jgi:hypothetical protein
MEEGGMAAKVREAVGVFRDEHSLEGTVDELLVCGFDRADISLLAGHEAVERELGHRYEKVAELEDDPRAPRLAYADIHSRNEGKASMVGALAYVGAIAASGMVVASGGTLALAIAAAAMAGGGGGMIGAMLARNVEGRHARWLQQQLDEGGLLLWVRVTDDATERCAVEALRRHSAEDVHVHELPLTGHLLEGGQSRKLSFMERLGL